MAHWSNCEDQEAVPQGQLLEPIGILLCPLESVLRQLPQIAAPLSQAMSLNHIAVFHCWATRATQLHLLSGTVTQAHACV